jgi:hypothetical protein
VGDARGTGHGGKGAPSYVLREAGRKEGRRDSPRCGEEIAGDEQRADAQEGGQGAVSSRRTKPGGDGMRQCTHQCARQQRKDGREEPSSEAQGSDKKRELGFAIPNSPERGQEACPTGTLHRRA